jgi:hypothetical protein
MTDDEWDRRLAAVKDLNSEADEIAVAICDLEGGDAEVEGTQARYDVFEWVWSLPKFSRPARRKIMFAN